MTGTRCPPGLSPRKSHSPDNGWGGGEICSPRRQNHSLLPNIFIRIFVLGNSGACINMIVISLLNQRSALYSTPPAGYSALWSLFSPTPMLVSVAGSTSGTSRRLIFVNKDVTRSKILPAPSSNA